MSGKQRAYVGLLKRSESQYPGIYIGFYCKPCENCGRVLHWDDGNDTRSGLWSLLKVEDFRRVIDKNDPHPTFSKKLMITESSKDAESKKRFGIVEGNEENTGNKNSNCPKLRVPGWFLPITGRMVMAITAKVTQRTVNYYIVLAGASIEIGSAVSNILVKDARRSTLRKYSAASEVKLPCKIAFDLRHHGRGNKKNHKQQRDTICRDCQYFIAMAAEPEKIIGDYQTKLVYISGVLQEKAVKTNKSSDTSFKDLHIANKTSTTKGIHNGDNTSKTETSRSDDEIEVTETETEMDDNDENESERRQTNRKKDKINASVNSLDGDYVDVVMDEEIQESKTEEEMTDELYHTEGIEVKTNADNNGDDSSENNENADYESGNMQKNNANVTPGKSNRGAKTTNKQSRAKTDEISDDTSTKSKLGNSKQNSKAISQGKKIGNMRKEEQQFVNGRNRKRDHSISKSEKKNNGNESENENESDLDASDLLVPQLSHTNNSEYKEKKKEKDASLLEFHEEENTLNNNNTVVEHSSLIYNDSIDLSHQFSPKVSLCAFQSLDLGEEDEISSKQYSILIGCIDKLKKIENDEYKYTIETIVNKILEQQKKSSSSRIDNVGKDSENSSDDFRSKEGKSIIFSDLLSLVNINELYSQFYESGNETPDVEVERCSIYVDLNYFYKLFMFYTQELENNNNGVDGGAEIRESTGLVKTIDSTTKKIADAYDLSSIVSLSPVVAYSLLNKIKISLENPMNEPRFKKALIEELFYLPNNKKKRTFPTSFSTNNDLDYYGRDKINIEASESNIYFNNFLMFVDSFCLAASEELNKNLEIALLKSMYEEINQVDIQGILGHSNKSDIKNALDAFSETYIEGNNIKLSEIISKAYIKNLRLKRTQSLSQRASLSTDSLSSPAVSTITYTTTSMDGTTISNNNNKDFLKEQAQNLYIIDARLRLRAILDVNVNDESITGVPFNPIPDNKIADLLLETLRCCVEWSLAIVPDKLTDAFECRVLVLPEIFKYSAVRNEFDKFVYDQLFVIPNYTGRYGSSIYKNNFSEEENIRLSLDLKYIRQLSTAKTIIIIDNVIENDDFSSSIIDDFGEEESTAQKINTQLESVILLSLKYYL